LSGTAVVPEVIEMQSEGGAAGALHGALQRARSARPSPPPRAWAWMSEHGYEPVSELRGSISHATTPDPGAFERAHYRRTLHSWAGRS
jgi:hypothetical protein